MNGFTPIEQLPMPPQFMLDELEVEMSTIFPTPSAIAISKYFEEIKSNKTKSNKDLKDRKVALYKSIDIEVNDEFFDAISYKDKSKGERVKPEMWNFAEKLHKCWNEAMRDYMSCGKVIHWNNGKYNIEKVFECGFNKWIVHNLKHCEKKKKNKTICIFQTEIPK
jgi:hypothetical protein